MNTQVNVQESTKKGSTKKGENKAKEAKEVVIAKLSQRTVDQLEKTKLYDSKTAGTFDALLQGGRDADLENLSFGKKIEHFLSCAIKRLNGIMKDEKLAKLTFKNVKTFKDESEKYKDLAYVSTHQAKLIVNAYIKSIDGNVGRGERVAKQGGIVGKKADKLQRNGANVK